MQYVVLNTLGQAQEILLQKNPLFPDVPLEARYSMEFLNQCLQVPDSVDIILGNVWDSENVKFIAPPPPPISDFEEEPDPDLPPSPTVRERLEAIEAENARLKNTVAATVSSNAFLEECVVEMAGIIYG